MGMAVDQTRNQSMPFQNLQLARLIFRRCIGSGQQIDDPAVVHHQTGMLENLARGFDRNYPARLNHEIDLHILLRVINRRLYVKPASSPVRQKTIYNVTLLPAAASRPAMTQLYPTPAQPVILIVDDTPENITVLGELLQPYYTVKVATDGRRALASAIKPPHPDLILLDVMMPELDGYAVLARLREAAETRDIPVVFVTALDASEDESRGLELGAADYITKPIRPPIVLARVRAQLELKQARDRLRDQNQWLEAKSPGGCSKTRKSKMSASAP